MTLALGADGWCLAEFNDRVCLCEIHVVGASGGVMDQNSEVV